MMNFLEKIKNFARDESGVSSIEFVMLFPAAFGLVALDFDAALLMLRYTNLEGALDRSVREVRLHGFPASETQSRSEYFIEEICKNAALIKDCTTSLAVEMSPIDTSTGFSKPTEIKCINRNDDNQPVIEFTPGSQNDVVYLRACLVVDRFFPNSLPGVFTTDASGGVRLVADSAYVVEPL